MVYSTAILTMFVLTWLCQIYL